MTGVWIIPLTRAREPPIIYFGVTTCHHVVDDPMDGSGRMSAPAAVSAPARSNRRIMWLWAPEFADGCYLGPYSTRRRRLSSITRAPRRKVMGVRGQRSQAARNVASAT